MPEVKLKDIADEIGVSTVTVSNALSGKKGVSDRMRSRIEAVARKMGYNVDRYTRKEEGGFRVGVLVADIYIEVGNSFYWALYQQLAFAASKTQSVTMLEVLDSELQKSKELPKMLQENAVDGMIIIGWLFRPYIENLVKHAGVPIVLLDFAVKGLKCDAVLSSNYTGMYKMVRYLLSKGHRDIAYVGSRFANENIMDRYYGYRKALMENNIRFRKEWVLEDRDLITGEVRISLPENMPTAFACNSDLTASALYDLLRQRGYRIPEDISIVGYDNYLIHSFASSLTTYNVDMKRMASIALKLLLGKIRGVEKNYGIRYIDSTIIERSSVKELR